MLAGSVRVSGCLQSVLAPHGCKAREEFLDPGRSLPEMTLLVRAKAQGTGTQQETTQEADLKLPKQKRARINYNEAHHASAGENKVEAEPTDGTELNKKLGGRREGGKEMGLFDASSLSHPRNAQKPIAESEIHLG